VVAAGERARRGGGAAGYGAGHRHGVTWTVAGARPARAGALLALPSCALAVAANLAAQHALAGTAFWLSDAKATWFLYQKLVFLLGGMLLPLQLFPAWLERVA
jgi:ABC-2 type transport system permease protein